MISTVNILLFILMFVAIFLIFKNYQDPLNGKTFLIGIYLYIIFSILFVSLASQYIASMNLFNENNYWKYLLGFLILGFVSICIIYNSNIIFNHLGLLLFLLAVSLLLSVFVSDSQSLGLAGLITSIIIILLTSYVYYAPESELVKLSNWGPTLSSILCLLVIFELVFMFFAPTFSQIKILSFIGAVLFVFFILSDTARIMYKTNNLECNTQTCINYPSNAISLMLDYLNLFTSVASGSNS